jgi:putative ABC transport system permease protein
MKTPLAWLNLTHNKLRTGVALAGVAFAVILMFMQLGFLGSAWHTASLIYDQLDFDILVRAKQSRRLATAAPFPETRLYEVGSTPGVQSVSGLCMGFNRFVRHRPDARFNRRIFTLGAKPGDAVFRNAEMQEKLSLLSAPEFALIDRASRGDYGPADENRFGDADLGTELELGNQRFQLVGHFLLGNSFEADGTLLVSRDGFLRGFPGWPADYVTLGLLKLEPGADPYATIELMYARGVVAPDVSVHTKADLIAAERRLWLFEQSIGIIFCMGVVVAVVVGAMIVYQVLATDIAKHLPEYATLRAMGYGDGHLRNVVLQQALLLALLGFVPGWAVAWLLYLITAVQTRLPIYMTWTWMGLVLLLTVAMCTISGLAALRKLRAADPADLY